MLTGVACKNGWESVDHLLIRCSYAYDLWTFVFSLFNISWVMPKQVVELLVSWHRGAGQHQAATVFWWGGRAIPVYYVDYLEGTEEPNFRRGEVLYHRV